MKKMILAAAAAFLIAVPAAAGSYSGDATSYHKCDGSSTKTADSGHVYFGQVASNTLPMHSWIETVSPRRIAGRRFFRVTDTGGPGFLIDIYAPYCSWADAWGRRTVTVRRVTRFWKGRPAAGWHWRCCWGHPHWSPA